MRYNRLEICNVFFNYFVFLFIMFLSILTFTFSGKLKPIKNWAEASESESKTQNTGCK